MPAVGRELVVVGLQVLVRPWVVVAAEIELDGDRVVDLDAQGDPSMAARPELALRLVDQLGSDSSPSPVLVYPQIHEQRNAAEPLAQLGLVGLLPPQVDVPD